MTFFEAIALAKEGKKITYPPTFGRSEYVVWEDDGFGTFDLIRKYTDWKTTVPHNEYFSLNQIESDKWEVWEE